MRFLIFSVLILFSFFSFSQNDPNYDDAFKKQYQIYVNHLINVETLSSEAFQALEDSLLKMNSFVGTQQIAETYFFNNINRPADIERALELLKLSFANGNLYGASNTAAYFRQGGHVTAHRIEEFRDLFIERSGESMDNFFLVRDIILALALGLGDQDLINDSKKYFHSISPSGLEIENKNFVSLVREDSILNGQIQVGDQILSLNNKEINDYVDFREGLIELKEGQRATLVISRNGQKRNVRFKAKKRVSIPYEHLALGWISFKQSNYDEALDFVEQYLNHPLRTNANDNENIYVLATDAMAKALQCLATGYPATINPEDFPKRLIDVCKDSLKGFNSLLSQYGFTDPDNNSFSQFRLSGFNPMFYEAYDQINGFLASYYLGPFRFSGLDPESTDLDLAIKHSSASRILHINVEEVMLDVLIELAKIDLTTPIPPSTFKEIDKELLSKIEFLAKTESNQSVYAKNYLTIIYRHHEEFKNPNAEMELLLELSDIDFERYYAVQRLAYLFYEKGEYEVATKYMQISRDEYSSKHAAQKLGHWFAETEEIYDLDKAYQSFKRGEELGSSYSSGMRLAILLDHKINVSKDEFDTVIEKNLFKLNNPKYFRNADFHDHVVQGYLSGSASYTKDDDLLCKYAGEGIKLSSKNHLSKLWNGWCILIDNRPGSKQLALKHLKEVAEDGSSAASLYLSIYYQDLGGLSNLERSLDWNKKSLDQNKDKDYVPLNLKYSWVEKDSGIFNSDITYIRSLRNEIKNEIQKEKNYLAALKRAEEEKEKKRLALLREQQRAKSRERTAEVASGFFSFLGDVLVVAGTIALAAAAVDVIADADPEVLDAFANSFETYTYDWDGFYDQYGNWTYRCRTIQTGRFAENYNCSGKFKDDDRWPTN